MEKKSKKEVVVEMSQAKEVSEHENLSDGYFGIDRSQIETLITKYEQRNVDEELIFLSTIGGDNGLLNSLKSNPQTGISEDEDELARRRFNFGENTLEDPGMKGFCTFVWEALGDMMLQILIVAAIVQTVLGATVGADPAHDWIDGISIIVAVVVVVLVGSITNYQKEMKFKQLNDKNSDMTKYVITRNGVSREVNADDILVGDIVSLELGMIIPADAMLISGTMKTDESTLTGESHLLQKETLAVCLKKKEALMAKGKPIESKSAIPSPIVFSGTNASEGGCKCIVLAVGKYSIKGKIRETVLQAQESDESKTPLEEKLEDIAGQIGYFGLVSAIVTLVALFIQFGTSYPPKVNNYTIATQNQAFLENFAGNFPAILTLNSTIKATIDATLIDPVKTVSGSILNIFLLCVAIIVVAIPEGLPLAVTLALSFSIKQMMKENNLVRKMQACETMGGANYICTDKTGTLTQNIMSVVSIFDGREIIETEDVTRDIKKRESPTKFFKSNEYYKILKLAICCNIEATLNESDEITKGNKSDLGFINLFKILGEKIYNIRKKYIGDNVVTIAFNSDRKRMTTFVKSSEFPTGYRMFIKGASDILIDLAGFSLDPITSEPKVLSDIEKGNFEGVVKEFGNKTLRTIVVCYKDISADDFNNYKEADESGLVIVGIVGIRDTLRDKVPEAVETCHKAGIIVVMVTGDLKNTAVAIARQCNIIGEKTQTENTNIAMTGEEFYTRIGGLECETCERKIEKCDCPKTKTQAKQRGLDEEKIRKDKIGNESEFNKFVPEVRVIARCRPMDKYALVLGLKKMGHVVAVTGDGTNDAPALSKSDVGFAMGIQGTDIAKDASDIIIVDDNFASIITAVLWGRNIFDNIRKFIQFQLSVNICACILVFITACIGNETPLVPIQMLWVNLIMDSLGSLALATEPPHLNLLLRKPYSRRERIINLKMWKHILIQAMVSLAILLFLYLAAYKFVEEDDSNRISEMQLIFDCYGKLPGGSVPTVNEDGTKTWLILPGSSSNWSSKDQIANPLLCGDSYIKFSDLSRAFGNYNSRNGATVHMTIVFNTFVFYTLFNQINARVIDDGLNIFYRITINPLFIVITFFEMLLQALLIQFGSSAFRVATGGLTGKQWLICVAFGTITFLCSFVTKFIAMEGCLGSVINCIMGEKNSNKVGNVNDNPDKESSLSQHGQVLNVEENQSHLKRDASSKKRNSFVNTLVRSRSKQMSKVASHHSLRKDKEN